MSLEVERPGDVVSHSGTMAWDGIGKRIADAETLQQGPCIGWRVDCGTSDCGSHNPGEPGGFQGASIAFTGQEHIPWLKHGGVGVVPELQVIRFEIEAQNLVADTVQLLTFLTESIDQ